MGRFHHDIRPNFTAVTIDEEDDTLDGLTKTPLFEIYRKIHQALSHILESLDLERTTVMFFSVHGMMRDYGQNHLVKPLMDRLNQVFLRRYLGREVRARSMGGLVGWLRSVVPTNLQYTIGEAAPDRVRHWWRNARSSAASTGLKHPASLCAPMSARN